MKNSIELRTGALNNYDTELVVVDIYQAPALRTLIYHTFSYNTLDQIKCGRGHAILAVAHSLVLKCSQKCTVQSCRSLWEPQLARLCIS